MSGSIGDMEERDIRGYGSDGNGSRVERSAVGGSSRELMVAC